jgi:hypothetical protein
MSFGDFMMLWALFFFLSTLAILFVKETASLDVPKVLSRQNFMKITAQNKLQ